MLSGEEYWTAQTLTALISQIVYEPMKKPSDRGAQLGPAYDEWFLKCCARDPKDRFASAGVAVAALAKAFDLPDADRFVPDAAPSVRLQIEEIVPPTSARAEKPLSKTDLQLATTGLAGRPSEPPRSKTMLALIAAGLLFGIGGVAFYVSHNASNGASTGASDGDKRTTAAATATSTETTAIRPEATATSTAVAQSVAVVPATSATVAEPPATVSAATTARPTNPPPHPVKLPAGPATTPPAATTTAPVVKPPPPPTNPLDSRQ
jgi:serine/threonine-protein kinase